jgi:RHS repeat-associated protein
VTKEIPVYFDNLQVTHIRGPLVSEDHYYPFGERMFGICSESLNFGNSKTQKKKYNGIEKENDLSIEMYDAQLRDLDGQIGRWWQVDPKTEKMEMWSPYASNYDNPILYSDPLGDEGGCCWGEIKAFFSELGDRADQRLGQLRDWAVDTWNQAGANLKARWNARADPLHQMVDQVNEYGPLALMPTPVGPISLVNGALRMEANGIRTAVNTEKVLLKNEIKASSRLSSQSLSTNVKSNVVKSPASDFKRLETISGKQSSRTVGANMKIINSGGELAPIKVAEIDGTKYILDGHHRVEAAVRTGTEVKYQIIPQDQWSAYGYKSGNEIKIAAANASAEKLKLNGKVVKEYASQ